MKLPNPLSRIRSHRRLRALARRLISVSAALTGTVTHVSTGESVAALTFDDGPDPFWTPRVVDLLEDHESRGTFFMVGKAAVRHPDLVARVARGEHAIGNHSWDHSSFPLLRGRWRRTQIRWCQEALEPYGLPLFRPPFGHQSLASQLDAVRLGYRVVAWQVNAEDWRDDPAEIVAERVRRRLRNGSIVLFHDGLYRWEQERFRDRGPTLRALEILLTELRGRYRFVTVPQLLRMGAPRKWHWYHAPNLDYLHILR